MYGGGLLLCVEHPLGGTTHPIQSNPGFSNCDFSRIDDDGEMKVQKQIISPAYLLF